MKSNLMPQYNCNKCEDTGVVFSINSLVRSYVPPKMDKDYTIFPSFPLSTEQDICSCGALFKHHENKTTQESTETVYFVENKSRKLAFIKRGRI